MGNQHPLDDYLAELEDHIRAESPSWKLDQLCQQFARVLDVRADAPRWERFPAATEYYRAYVARLGRD